MLGTERIKQQANGRVSGTDSGVSAGEGAELFMAQLLVERADQLRLRAPEVALVLAERAAGIAEAAGLNEPWVRAEGVAVLCNVALGYRAETVGRAVTALGAAEDGGLWALAANLRTALATCARSIGLPLTGLAALRPALFTAGLTGSARATGLSHLVGCMAELARKPELDRVLSHADRLCSTDGTLDDDGKLVLRALLRVAASGHRRRHGDLVGAADAARTGIGFLDDLTDKTADGGAVRVRLVLELACALLDRGETAVALELAQPVLAEPPRSSAVAPHAWLKLAIATRVHLPAGSADAATRLLRDAVHDTERRHLNAVTARLWLELAHVEERLARPADALEAMRRARVAERIHARNRGRASAALAGAFGTGGQADVDLAEVLAVSSHTIDGGSNPLPPSVKADVVPADSTAIGTAAQDAAVQDAAAEEDIASATAATNEPSVTGTGNNEVRATRDGHGSGTRHNEEHGSVAARSVLDRLGISAGASTGHAGRRRRAPQPESASTEATTRSEAGTSSAGSAGADPAGTDHSGTDSSEAERPAGEPAIHEPHEWLPRLRLPPSLAPFEELEGGEDTAGQHTGARVSENAAEPDQHPAPQAVEPPDDEPPADAGLAELLARALAEHQAGTSSAAALVKQLGTGHSDEQHVNGRHRNSE